MASGSLFSSFGTYCCVALVATLITGLFAGFVALLTYAKDPDVVSQYETDFSLENELGIVNPDLQSHDDDYNDDDDPSNNLIVPATDHREEHDDNVDVDLFDDNDKRNYHNNHYSNHHDSELDSALHSKQHAAPHPDPVAPWNGQPYHDRGHIMKRVLSVIKNQMEVENKKANTAVEDNNRSNDVLYKSEIVHNSLSTREHTSLVTPASGSGVTDTEHIRKKRYNKEGTSSELNQKQALPTNTGGLTDKDHHLGDHKPHSHTFHDRLTEHTMNQDNRYNYNHHVEMGGKLSPREYDNHDGSVELGVSSIDDSSDNRPEEIDEYSNHVKLVDDHLFGVAGKTHVLEDKRGTYEKGIGYITDEHGVKQYVTLDGTPVAKQDHHALHELVQKAAENLSKSNNGTMQPNTTTKLKETATNFRNNSLAAPILIQQDKNKSDTNASVNQPKPNQTGAATYNAARASHGIRKHHSHFHSHNMAHHRVNSKKPKAGRTSMPTHAEAVFLLPNLHGTQGHNEDMVVKPLPVTGLTKESKESVESTAKPGVKLYYILQQSLTEDIVKSNKTLQENINSLGKDIKENISTWKHLVLLQKIINGYPTKSQDEKAATLIDKRKLQYLEPVPFLNDALVDTGAENLATTNGEQIPTTMETSTKPISGKNQTITIPDLEITPAITRAMELTARTTGTDRISQEEITTPSNTVAHKNITTEPNHTMEFTTDLVENGARIYNITTVEIDTDLKDEAVTEVKMAPHVSTFATLPILKDQPSEDYTNPVPTLNWHVLNYNVNNKRHPHHSDPINPVITLETNQRGAYAHIDGDTALLKHELAQLKHHPNGTHMRHSTSDEDTFQLLFPETSDDDSDSEEDWKRIQSDRRKKREITPFYRSHIQDLTKHVPGTKLNSTQNYHDTYHRPLLNSYKNKVFHTQKEIKPNNNPKFTTSQHSVSKSTKHVVTGSKPNKPHKSFDSHPELSSITVKPQQVPGIHHILNSSTIKHYRIPTSYPTLTAANTEYHQSSERQTVLTYATTKKSEVSNSHHEHHSRDDTFIHKTLLQNEYTLLKLIANLSKTAEEPLQVSQNASSKWYFFQDTIPTKWVVIVSAIVIGGLAAIVTIIVLRLIRNMDDSFDTFKWWYSKKKYSGPSERKELLSQSPSQQSPGRSLRYPFGSAHGDMLKDYLAAAFDDTDSQASNNHMDNR